MNAGWGLWPRISWNPPDFTLKSGGFHLWNPAEFTQISSMKSTQNYKSKCFSKNSSVWWMQGGGYDQGFNEIHMKSARFHVKSARFHEIHWISWNPLKSGGFHEIRRISCEIERPLARNCNPMFLIVLFLLRCTERRKNYRYFGTVRVFGIADYNHLTTLKNGA